MAESFSSNVGPTCGGVVVGAGTGTVAHAAVVKKKPSTRAAVVASLATAHADRHGVTLVRILAG